MQRVVIVGGNGAGKTKLAHAISRRTGLPITHVDSLREHPGYIVKPHEELADLIQKATRRDRWILDGTDWRTIASQIERADTLIWIDVPVIRRLIRIVRRNIANFGHQMPDLPEGCPQRFKLSFYKDVWRKRNWARKVARKAIRKAPAHIDCHVLRSRREIEAFLGTLQPVSGTEHF